MKGSLEEEIGTIPNLKKKPNGGDFSLKHDAACQVASKASDTELAPESEEMEEAVPEMAPEMNGEAVWRDDDENAHRHTQHARRGKFCYQRHGYSRC